MTPTCSNAIVSGYVRDKTNDLPIEGVRVWLTELTGQQDSSEWTTGSDGSYRVTTFVCESKDMYLKANKVNYRKYSRLVTVEADVTLSKNIKIAVK